MLKAVIDNPVIEDFLVRYHPEDIDKVIESLLLEFIQQKYEPSPGDKLEIFEKLMAENQQYDLQIPPEVDLSELADEVNE